MPKIIAVANQKGGVGKTFLVFHLAHFLAEKGFRTLAIDLDPQGNLSLAFTLARGWEPRCLAAEIFAAEKIVAEEVEKNLLLVSSEIGLARYEASAGGVSIYFKLKKALEAWPEKEALDFVLIDCPPSLGLFSLSALVASKGLLIPLRPEIFSVSGLGDLLQIVKEVRENINPGLEILGLLINAVQERTRVAKQTILELEKDVKLPILARFPASIKAEEALRQGVPVWHLAPESPLSRTLRRGLNELLQTKLAP